MKSAIRRLFSVLVGILEVPLLMLIWLISPLALYEHGLEKRARREQRKIRDLLDRACTDLEKEAWEQAAATVTEVIGMPSLTSSSRYMNPALIEAYHRRAIAYLGLGQLDDALADCNRVIMADPTPITRADAVPPYVAETYLQRGVAFARMGQHDKAIADFTEAIQLAPGLRTPYALRAQSRRAIGDTERAAEDESMASRPDTSRFAL